MYEKGIKISDDDLNKINLQKDFMENGTIKSNQIL
jgi:hypothetical protein